MEKKKMELWFSDYHTEKVKLSVKVQKQLFEQQTDFQRMMSLNRMSLEDF